jgi:hypothetical protein
MRRRTYVVASGAFQHDARARIAWIHGDAFNEIGPELLNDDSEKRRAQYLAIGRDE